MLAIARHWGRSCFALHVAVLLESKLRPLAAIYVAVVSVAGAVIIARAVPGVDGTHPLILAALMALSLLASIAKITIPVPGSDSSLTVCHVIDFTTLIVCGTDAA